MKTTSFISATALAVSIFICSSNQTWSQPASVKKNATVFFTKRKPGDPLQHLPANIEVLTSFGERADISPDNKRIAFMAKGFGDAMVIDIKTRKITCLTCQLPGAAFVRVMHLSTNDYLLIGPERFENAVASKKNNDIWFLSKKPGSMPVKLGPKVSEGIAISKKTSRIVFTETGTDKSSKLIMADLIIANGSAALENKKLIIENLDTSCTVEAQDFYENDTRLTFFCYVPNAAFEVRGIDIANGQVTNFSQAPGFNEPEGIFPDGKYTTVESDRQCEWLGGQRGSSNIDIWKLKLDGTGKDFVRLTHFNDYEGGKVANPVVATNGKFMALQVSKSTDPPGMGHGLLLYWFGKQKL